MKMKKTMMILVVLVCSTFLLYGCTSGKSGDKETSDAIAIERNDKKIDVTDAEDVKTINKIIDQAQYTSDPCNGIVSCTIIKGDKRYLVKADCKGIEKEGKQAEFSSSDWKTLTNILEKYK